MGSSADVDLVLSGSRYKESELNMGENSCIDRCVSKYWQVGGRSGFSENRFLLVSTSFICTDLFPCSISAYDYNSHLFCHWNLLWSL